MPIWNFGRGVLGFFETPTGTRGVVSLAIQGESVVIILDMDRWTKCIYRLRIAALSIMVRWLLDQDFSQVTD